MRLFLIALIIAAGTVTFAGGLPAQSSNPASAFLQAIQPRRAGSYIGVTLQEVDVNRARILGLGDARGAEVIGVGEGSPAAAAGIKRGDVLLSYNGENILGTQQLGRLVGETPIGRKVAVQYWRNGKTAEATIVTGELTTSNWPLPDPANFDVGNAGDLAFFDIPHPLILWKNLLLGVDCEPLDAQLAGYFGVRHGILIRSVDKGSASDKAGLKAGDVLTGIGGKDISSTHDVNSYVHSARRPAKEVTVELIRDHKSVTLHIALSERQEP